MRLIGKRCSCGKWKDCVFTVCAVSKHHWQFRISELFFHFIRCQADVKRPFIVLYHFEALSNIPIRLEYLVVALKLHIETACPHFWNFIGYTKRQSSAQSVTTGSISTWKKGRHFFSMPSLVGCCRLWTGPSYWVKRGINRKVRVQLPLWYQNTSMLTW